MNLPKFLQGICLLLNAAYAWLLSIDENLHCSFCWYLVGDGASNSVGDSHMKKRKEKQTKIAPPLVPVNHQPLSIFIPLSA